jgi:hypothetical protein
LGCAPSWMRNPTFDGTGLNLDEVRGLERLVRSLSSGRLDSAGGEARLISGYRVVQLHGGGLAGSQLVTAADLYPVIMWVQIPLVLGPASIEVMQPAFTQRNGGGTSGARVTASVA